MSEETAPVNGEPITTLEDAAQFRALELLVDRMLFARSAGMTFNGQRDTWLAFGYDDIITAKQYRDRYARGGVAKRIVDALPNATWRGDVELVEDEDPKKFTAFEEAWGALSTRLKVPTTLCRVDKLSRLSTYAVLLIGTKVPGDLETELPRGKSQEQITFLSPFAGGGGPGFTERAGASQDISSSYVDATIRDLDTDPRSERFGLPLSYQLRRLDASNPALQRPIHWSRVIHVAEGCLDNEVYGTPALECCWNLLDDLEKVTGGGAEAFYLRANPGLHANIDKDSKLAPDDPQLTALRDQVDRWRHKMSDRAFRTKGIDIKMLSSDVANFSQPADGILTQIAGATSMPKRILTGSEMGELASSQDRDNWKDQINGRQTGHAGPNVLRQLADRLIKYGYLPEPKQYEVRWAHIQTLTEQEKAEGAKNWAATNSTNGEEVFAGSEIRDKWYGMPPLTDEQKKEIADAKAAAAPAAPPPADAGTLAVLEAAIEAKNVDVISAIIGIRREDERRKFATTQVQLPPDMADALAAFEIEDLVERETDAHVTVKYGLLSDDPDDVRKKVENFGPVTLELGAVGVFSAREHDVVQVAVVSDDLVRLNRLVASVGAVDTQPFYQPHATIAYVKPGTGARYAGDARFVGMRATVDSLVFSPSDRGGRTEVPLG